MKKPVKRAAKRPAAKKSASSLVKQITTKLPKPAKIPRSMKFTIENRPWLTVESLRAMTEQEWEAYQKGDFGRIQSEEMAKGSSFVKVWSQFKPGGLAT